MAVKTKREAQQPLVLRAHRLMEAFAKSDDERDFYLDRMEGFIIYVDLDKSQEELDALDKELEKNPERYCMIPKLTFYEAKKIMEGFVNEKVYDIDTKEKLLDIIQSKEARANFLEFIYDHHSELEKWQQYYQERSRIRIIEWLRQHHFHFVFEEDLELARTLLEKLKQSLFETRVGKDVQAARKILVAKAKSYYSNEALNPRPKRGRPPKQAIKQEIEPQITSDIYLTVPAPSRPFLFTPEITGASGVTFSADFDTQRLTARRQQLSAEPDTSLAGLQQKLASLRQLSSRWVDQEKSEKAPSAGFENEEEDEDVEDIVNGTEVNKSVKKTRRALPIKKKLPVGQKNQNQQIGRKPVNTPSKNSTKSLKGVGKASKAANQVNGDVGKRQKHKRIIPVQKAVSKGKVTPVGKTKIEPSKIAKKPAVTPIPTKKEQKAPSKAIMKRIVVNKPKRSVPSKGKR